jgi:thioredoxin-related protein
MKDENIKRAARKIEVGANVAIIIVALAIVVVFARSYKSNQSQPHQIGTGTQFGLKDMSGQGNDKSMVLVLSTTCHFCSESAGFYRALVGHCQRQHVRTVAVFPQPTNAAQSYLADKGVAVDEVRQSSLSNIEVTGTPTLLLIDKKGIVQSVWVGKLSEDREREILAKLGS